MLVTMKSILDKAYEGKYCVAAPNFMDERQIRLIVEAAEEMHSPVIIDAVLNEFMKVEDFREWIWLAADLAKRASVPVAINLDHGSKYEYIMQALNTELTSIMIDRSSLPLEQNIAEVKELTKAAHALGKSVEAELGHVGNNVGLGIQESNNNKTILTEEDKRETFTKVDEAVRFVKETGVDCLAVAVGTVHGLYPKGFKPSIDFELLEQIRDAVNIPLVLHGGSGSGEENLAKAAKLGVCKLNVASDLIRAAREALGDYYKNNVTEGNPINAYYNGYKEMLKHYMSFLGSENKA